MKKYNNVVFDIDNTVTELDFVLEHMGEYFKKPIVGVDDVLDFNLGLSYGVDPDEDLTFWKTQEYHLVKNAILSQRRLQNILDTYTNSDTKIHYVSARPEGLLDTTTEWLESHGLEFETVACIGSESKIDYMKDNTPGVEAVFEDNPNFFKEVDERGHSKDFDMFCIDYGYNRTILHPNRLDRDTGLPS